MSAHTLALLPSSSSQAARYSLAFPHGMTYPDLSLKGTRPFILSLDSRRCLCRGGCLQPPQCTIRSRISFSALSSPMLSEAGRDSLKHRQRDFLVLKKTCVIYYGVNISPPTSWLKMTGICYSLSVGQESRDGLAECLWLTALMKLRQTMGGTLASSEDIAAWGRFPFPALTLLTELSSLNRSVWLLEGLSTGLPRHGSWLRHPRKSKRPHTVEASLLMTQPWKGHPISFAIFHSLGVS